MKDITEIKAYLSRKKPQLKKYGITEIGIFGSYIKKSATTKSDIDILIDIQRPSTIGEATKRLPDGLREANADIPWKAMAGTRDRLIHGYNVEIQ